MGSVDILQTGYVDLAFAVSLCTGFIIETFFDAKIPANLPGPVLEKIFRAALLIIALKMIFSKQEFADIAIGNYLNQKQDYDPEYCLADE